MRPAFPLRLRGGSAGAKLQSGTNVTDVDVVRVLAHMLTPDSEKIRAAEEEMDEIIRKQPANCIKGLLVCMLCEGTAMELRQLAAVLLRRRINDMWAKLSDEQQNDVQLRLGDALVENLASTSGKLRRLLALCVSSVAALSSTAVQLDSVVERILSAANSTEASPTSAAVAISILEMLMESIAHDMHRHIPQVHEATLAALQHTHADVRTSSVKLASTLLVHALGRTNAGFSGELMQRLHSMLARAVVECDSATADCIFQSLTEVVPFVWDLEACTRTQHMLTLALNVTAQAAMPLKVRERASLFIVELVQCQAHVLRDQRAFGSLARSLTNQACRALLEQSFFLFSEQTACTPDLAPLLCIARGEDTQESVFRDSLGSHVREKRESLLVGDEEEERGRIANTSTPVVVDEGAGNKLELLVEESNFLLHALRVVLQSEEGGKAATRAFAYQLDLLCSEDTLHHSITRVLLLRTCCEASRSSHDSQLHTLNMSSWVLTSLHAALGARDERVCRVALHAAPGMLAALSLDWSSELVQQLLRRLLDAARAHTQQAGDVAMVARSLGALMPRLSLQTPPAAVYELLPDLFAAFAHLMSIEGEQVRGQGGGGGCVVQQAAIQSLSGVVSAFPRCLRLDLLGGARTAIDPFLLYSGARGGGQSARSDVDECGTSVGEREVWVASVECVAALARGGTWDSAALQQHAVWMIERLLLALSDTDPDDSSVREAALAALRDVAEALDDSFYAFLPVVMPHVFQALEASQGLEDFIYGTPAALPLTQEGLEEAMRRIEDEQTSTCEEKTNAALALAGIARVTRERFGEFVDESMRALHAAAVAFQPSIRRAALTAIQACVACSVTAWSTPLRASRHSKALHAKTESHADTGIVTCLLALQDDDDAESVARACECVGAIARDAGWPFFRQYLKRLTKRTVSILEERALCNRRPERLPWLTARDLYAAVAQMLCSLSGAWAADIQAAAAAAAAEAQAHATPPPPAEAASEALWSSLKEALSDWHNLLDAVYPAVLDWAGPHQPAWLRRLGFGLLATVLRDLPSSLHPKAVSAFDRYSMPLLPLLNASLSQVADPPEGSGGGGGGGGGRLEEEEPVHVRRILRSTTNQMLQNAAYCLGVTAAQGSTNTALEALKSHGRLIALLQPSCPVDDAVRDNAAAALARMMSATCLSTPATTTSALFEAVVQAFPLRTDVAENAVVLELFDAVVDTGILDVSPWLKLLVPRLEEMQERTSACYARASDAACVLSLTRHARRLLRVLAMLQEEQRL